MNPPEGTLCVAGANWNPVELVIGTTDASSSSCGGEGGGGGGGGGVGSGRRGEMYRIKERP